MMWMSFGWNMPRLTNDTLAKAQRFSEWHGIRNDVESSENEKEHAMFNCKSSRFNLKKCDEYSIAEKKWIKWRNMLGQLIWIRNYIWWLLLYGWSQSSNKCNIMETLFQIRKHNKRHNDPSWRARDRCINRFISGNNTLDPQDIPSSLSYRRRLINFSSKISHATLMLSRILEILPFAGTPHHRIQVMQFILPIYSASITLLTLCVLDQLQRNIWYEPAPAPATLFVEAANTQMHDTISNFRNQ